MKWLAYAFIAIGLLNWAVYTTVGSRLGGDAVNGKIEGGKFYVGEHGHYTEVTEGIYRYSRLHTYCTWGLHALLMTGGLILVRLNVKAKQRKAARGTAGKSQISE